MEKKQLILLRAFELNKIKIQKELNERKLSGIHEMDADLRADHG